MRLTVGSRRALAFGIACGLALGCGRDPSTEPGHVATTAGRSGPSGRALDGTGNELDSVLNAHLTGLGAMERFEYGRAVAAFREVHTRSPGWNAGAVNLAIALLNQAGLGASDGSAGATFDPYVEALGLLDSVLKRDPNQLHAHYCRGIILETQGLLAEAHREFRFVTQHDPRDAHAWYRLASTLTDPDDPDRPAGPAQSEELIRLYTRALELNPYLVNVLYKLQAAYAWAGRADRQRELLERWKRLNPRNNAAAPGETLELAYGEMGRYASIIDVANRARDAAAMGPPPRFASPAPIVVELPRGERWASDSDFQGPSALVGRIRRRFGAGAVTFDADGDERADLFLPASVVGPKGVHDALFLNRGEGRFQESTAAFGLPDDRASLGGAAGDFDADGRLDLVLTGVAGNRLYRNLGGRFEEVVAQARGLRDSTAITLTARWLDLDQDGDLDLYLVNYASCEEAEAAFTDRPPPGVPNLVLRNDGEAQAIVGRPRDNWAPTASAPEGLNATAGLTVKFSAWPEQEALGGGDARHTGIAALDLDNDRDLDLVLASDGSPPVAVLNDRLGRFHATGFSWSAFPATVNGLLVVDVDKDGRADLAAVAPTSRLQFWRNTTERLGAGAGGGVVGESWPTDAERWLGAVAADLDLDTWPDLVGFAASAGGPAWARHEGKRHVSRLLALSPVPGPAPAGVGLVYSDLVGDPLPDLLIQVDGAPPRLATNLGNGRHWLALEMSGRWNVHPAPMRTNPQGLGTRVTLEGEGLKVCYDHTTPAAGLGQSVGPVVLGMGTSSSAALLRLRWPDGTMQCELNVTPDKRLKVVEHNRKTGSCPVLFTWNGERFVCQGDFIGGGGLGYLAAPGVYGEPDRDESILIAPGSLQPDRGVYRLTVNEPMDECAYLDQLALKIIDRPGDVQVALDERFSPAGTRPSGAVVAWRSSIESIRATDLQGRDVTEQLRRWDRKTVDGFARRDGWTGYAETHGVVLDFGDRLSRVGPETPLILCLAGWVEYPYSQTNYTAATAGVALAPPVIERRRDDGSWAVIEPNAGYPAGLPRMTTLDVTGKLAGPKCVLRIRTNMECYWDQAFVALREPNPPIRETTLSVARAQLAERGYLREVSPDGALPLLYDYAYVDPAPLSRLTGRLTRLGDVAPLLQGDDDRLCVIGPGDEVRLEFDAGLAPELPAGWTRSYVLAAVGYCKDADPFTAASDTVGPLPWRGMPAYPYPASGARPADPAYHDYLEAYQTRWTESR